MEQRDDASIDLVVAVMETDPTVVREGFAAADAVRATGATARVLELDTAPPDGEIAAAILAAGARAIALGASAATLYRVGGVAGRLMGANGAPVLLFGPLFASPAARRVVPRGGAAGIVVGQAAPVLAEVVAAARAGGKQGVIAGLDRMDGDLRPRTPERKLSLPGGGVSFQGIDWARVRRQGLPMRLGYGCPRRCAYCAEQPREGGLALRDPYEVADEMWAHFERNGVRRFHFCDLALNGDLEVFSALCERLLQRHVRQLTWWGRAVIDGRMSMQMLRQARHAGCVGLCFDVASGADSVLEAIGAGFNAEEAARVVHRATTAGIATTASFMVGLPTEHEQQFGETCDWIYENRYNLAQVRDVKPCRLDESSVLWRYAEQFHLTLPEHDPHGDWHDGGFNTQAYRLKRTRELRVFIEDRARLCVTGQAPAVSWAPDARAEVTRRLSALAQESSVASGRLAQQHLCLAGAAERGAAVAGPSYLEIDLTNNCNQHCAGCWIHSFLLGDERLQGEKRRATLPLDKLRELVASAKRMGARRIQLSGAGEPFMHPQVDEVLSTIKRLDLELNVISNFTLVDEERARRLVDLGVDGVTVSLWAGSAETYVKTHPTAKEELFQRVVDVVSYLTRYRRDTGATSPRVKIYNVISSLNAHEIHKMIDVARQMGADLIEFTPIDVVPGLTDDLALSRADSEAILDQLMSVRRRADYLQRTAEEVDQGRLPGLDEQGEYARFLQEHRLPTDFRFSMGDIRRWEAFCRRNVHCSYVYEEIERDSSIMLGFPPDECDGCLARPSCSVHPITMMVRAPYLSLQGFGSFWRRVHGDADGGRDAKIVDQVPCSIGYTYARVQATGHVIPCCKAATFPLGNIMEQPFEQVWYSPQYDEFRRKAISMAKSDPYFGPMECYKVCDNLGHNMAADQVLQQLSPAAREHLLAAARQRRKACPPGGR